ncbi:hypothetical protein M426DRAFT_74502 [Hypoxylon sp. CI-4A]|nr:hypothetical protein M426DRAFT_74502 [Hypoxylon sp. CI-4A]
MARRSNGQRNSRKHDIVLLGATGYTGLLTAEYIVRHLPTNLKWAIVGRSESKLEALAKKLKDLEPDRLQPEVEAISFDDRNQLDSVIRDSKVCISVVLYWKVGEVIVKSCVENQTDYIDVAGDVPILRTFIEKYHDAATKAGVALIHLCGAFGGPQDLLTWMTVRELAQKASRKTKEVVLSITEFELAPSGGTASSMMAMSTYDPQVLKQSRQPWILSPVKGVDISPSTNFLGMRQDPVLGLLSGPTISADENRVLVHRAWGLLRNTTQDYGPNFQYNEYNKVSSVAAGIFSMLNTAIVGFALSFGITRKILSLVFPAPGEGPDVEKTRRSPVKFEAVAIADSDDGEEPPRAYASFSYPSGAYHVTGLLLSQAAASLLYTRNLEGGFAGGCLTPAFLGDDFLNRIRSAGATIEAYLV